MRAFEPRDEAEAGAGDMTATGRIRFSEPLLIRHAPVKVTHAKSVQTCETHSRRWTHANDS